MLDYFQFYADERDKSTANEKGDAAVDDNEERLLEQDQNSKVEVVTRGPKGGNLLHIIARIWIWIVSVFMCFLATLAVFPAITANVRSTGFGLVSL